MCPNRNYSLSFSPIYSIFISRLRCFSSRSFHNNNKCCGVYETGLFNFAMSDVLRRWQLCARHHSQLAVRWAFIFNTKPIISSLGRYFYGFFFRVVPTRATVNSFFFFPRVHCFLGSIFPFFRSDSDQRNLLCRHVDG